MFDGMMAVEGGMIGPLGEIFNDLPDRISDVFIILGAGFSISKEPSILLVHLSWLASLLAVLTAYVRFLGASTGTPQFFVGPQAKPHRMFVLVGASLIEGLILPWLGFVELGTVMLLAIVVVIVGSFITCVRRSMMIVDVFTNKSS